MKYLAALKILRSVWSVKLFGFSVLFGKANENASVKY